MLDGPDERRVRAKGGETIAPPNAGQFAREPGVLDLRDDEPVAMIIAADQGCSPALNDRPIVPLIELGANRFRGSHAERCHSYFFGSYP